MKSTKAIFLKAITTQYGVQLPSVSRILIIATLVTIGWFHPIVARSNFVVNEYATVSDVIKSTFPTAATRTEKSLKISPDIQKQIEKQLGARWKVSEIEWLEIRNKSNRIGAVMVFDEIGKHYPITFAVALSEKNEIKSIAILIYREPIGANIRRPNFMNQFIGKALKDVGQMDESITPVTGSTLSSWAAITVAKKAVILGEMIDR